MELKRRSPERPLTIPASNRTIVELKPLQWELRPPGGGASNRTIVELKLRMKIDQTDIERTSNRTIVELKLMYCAPLRTISELLIAPSWN